MLPDLERRMLVAQDTKKDFSYNKSEGKWYWFDRSCVDQPANWHGPHNSFEAALCDATAPYFAEEAFAPSLQVFTDVELRAIAQIVSDYAELVKEDLVGAIVRSGAVSLLTETKTKDGLYRMVRNDLPVRALADKLWAIWCVDHPDAIPG